VLARPLLGQRSVVLGDVFRGGRQGHWHARHAAIRTTAKGFASPRGQVKHPLMLVALRQSQYALAARSSSMPPRARFPPEAASRPDRAQRSRKKNETIVSADRGAKWHREHGPAIELCRGARIGPGWSRRRRNGPERGLLEVRAQGDDTEAVGAGSSPRAGWRK